MAWRVSVYTLAMLVTVLTIMLVAAFHSPTSFDSRTLLAVWAVLGPLLSAAASAFWQRKVQLEDRTHANKVADDQRTHQTAREDLAYRRSRTHDLGKLEQDRLERERSNLISTVAEFLGAANIFMNAAQNSITVELMQPDSRDKAIKAHESFAAAYAKCCLVSDAKFTNLCSELWNASMGANFDLAKMDEAHEAGIQRIRTTRLQLILATQEMAASLRNSGIRAAQTDEAIQSRSDSAPIVPAP